MAIQDIIVIVWGVMVLVFWYAVDRFFRWTDKFEITPDQEEKKKE